MASRVDPNQTASWWTGVPAPNGTLSPAYDPGPGGRPASWLTGAFLSLACAVGSAGNLYTLGLTCRRGRPAGVGGCLRLHVSSLAASDLLYLSTVPFIVYSSWAKDWAFGDAGCRLLLSLDLATMHASIFTLVLMSRERYRAVARPLEARGGLRARRSRGELLGAWILALSLALPMAVSVRVEDRLLEDGASNRRLCAPGWSEGHQRLYLTLVFATSVAVPGLLIVGLYAGLARAYWKAQRVPPLGRGVPRSRLVLLTLAVVLSYWLCFLPFWMWQLVTLYLETFTLPFSTQGLVNDVLTGLTYANSCIDPFLYTLLTRRFRERGRGGGGGGGTRRRGTAVRKNDAEVPDSNPRITPTPGTQRCINGSTLDPEGLPNCPRDSP